MFNTKKKFRIILNEKVAVPAFKKLRDGERKCGRCNTRIPKAASVCSTCKAGQN